MANDDTPELAALRARTIIREQQLRRDAYRHMDGRHVTDYLIAGIGLIVAIIMAASLYAGRT